MYITEILGPNYQKFSKIIRHEVFPEETIILVQTVEGYRWEFEYKGVNRVMDPERRKIYREKVYPVEMETLEYLASNFPCPWW